MVNPPAVNPIKVSPYLSNYKPVTASRPTLAGEIARSQQAHPGAWSKATQKPVVVKQTMNMSSYTPKPKLIQPPQPKSYIRPKDSPTQKNLITKFYYPKEHSVSPKASPYLYNYGPKQDNRTSHEYNAGQLGVETRRSMDMHPFAWSEHVRNNIPINTQFIPNPNPSITWDHQYPPQNYKESKPLSSKSISSAKIITQRKTTHQAQRYKKK